VTGFGILAVEFANGAPCPHANQWLRTFDHEAFDGRGHGEFTEDPERAMLFATSADAMRFWQRQSTVKPLRPDGKPNRPLTALTVVIEPLA
jgi:hypothetical protein